MLKAHQGENIVISTHGTALSTILNYYDSSFNADNFFAIIDMMPYIIRLDFDDSLQCMSKTEVLKVYKKFEKRI